MTSGRTLLPLAFPLFLLLFLRSMRRSSRASVVSRLFLPFLLFFLTILCFFRSQTPPSLAPRPCDLSHKLSCGKDHPTSTSFFGFSVGFGVIFYLEKLGFPGGFYDFLNIGVSIVFFVILDLHMGFLFKFLFCDFVGFVCTVGSCMWVFNSATYGCLIWFCFQFQVLLFRGMHYSYLSLLIIFTFNYL